MREPLNDNIYPIGTLIQAKEDATLQLIVRKYYERIYYCGVVDHPEHKHLAYFEKELIHPKDSFDQKETLSQTLPEPIPGSMPVF